jgi:8-oxo-dGDP phosphatase
LSLQKWTVRRSSYVRNDRWIGLREDECVTAAGAVVAPYYVVEYPDWVQVAAFDDEDRVLLVRQYRHGSGEITLELPAGRIDPEDRDAAAAGARELFEETGCEATSITLLSVHWANPATQSNRIHTVLAEGVRQTGEPKHDPTEEVEAVWLPIDEAVGMAMRGELPHLAQVGSLLLALRQSGRLP